MKQITGMMVYYYFICHRKLWYFCNQIAMEQNSELVSIGKILDETSYVREKKQILIDGTINVDFIENGVILHEVKKSKSIEEAGIWQVKYYLYYLEKKGIQNMNASIDYPLLKEKKQIILDDKDKETLEKIERDIIQIIELEKPPKVLDSKVCKNCAYFDLCYIG